MHLKYRKLQPAFAYNEYNPSRDFSAERIYQLKFDEMRFRESPGLTTKVLATLSSPDEVAYLGVTSTRTDQVTLRGTRYSSHWYKVMTEDGVTGWIYGAAIGE